MATTELVTPSARLGQSAITLRTDQAASMPVMSDVPYKERLLRRPWVSYVGARPIHRTTLTLDRTKPKLDYVTLYKHYFKGSSQLNGVRRPPTCPSMFTSQWDIGENRQTHFLTQSAAMFPPKTGEPVSKMRKVQNDNRINNSHGLQMMNVTDMDSGPSYYTSYRVTHDALGKSRGDGVPHLRKKPQRFNVITGEATKLPDQINHRRRSGNRVLSSQRTPSRGHFQLG